MGRSALAVRGGMSVNQGPRVSERVLVRSVSTVFVIDNGEGDGAPADIVSLAMCNRAAGADAAFCANQPLVVQQLTVTDGTLQVR